MVVVIHATGSMGGTAATAPNLRQPVADTNGLVAWYPLDGDTKDYSGSNYNVTFGTGDKYVSGKFGKAEYFNGSSVNELFTVSPGVTLTSYTVSAWYAPVSVGSSYVYNGVVSSNINSLIESGSDTSNSWGIRYGISSSYSACTTQGHSLPPLVASTFYLFTTTVTPSSITLYQNGVLVTSCSTSSTWPALTEIAVGPDHYVSGMGAEGTSGSVDDVRVYNRALSATEIQQLYAGSSPQNYDQTCVMYLKFDENMGTAADSSGSGNTGTLHGTTTWITGNFASALLLDGSTGYVSLPNLGLTSGTVDMWINPTTLTGDQRLFSQASGASTEAGQIALNQSSGESGSLWVYDGSAWQRLSANGSVLANQWNQIVVENNGSTATDFVNGIQQLTATANFAFSGPTVSLGGKFLGTTGGYFNGAVDDFRVYSRTLAPEEVYDQWKQGS
jgi:hypothetical protein